MILLGIDPGLATTGFGLIEKKAVNQFICLDYGIIATKPNLSLGDRLVEIQKNLDELLKNSHPDYTALEELFFSKNIKTGLLVAQARGVILELLTRKNIPVMEIKPNTVKATLTGFGHAEKSQIQFMTKKLLNLPAIPKPDDAADALALAITCGMTLR